MLGLTRCTPALAVASVAARPARMEVSERRTVSRLVLWGRWVVRRRWLGSPRPHSRIALCHGDSDWPHRFLRLYTRRRHVIVSLSDQVQSSPTPTVAMLGRARCQ